MPEHNERTIPKAPERLPAEERQSLAARHRKLPGRTLVDDVAHLVRLEMECR